MVFFRKLNFRPDSSRKGTREPDALRVLLDEFKAAPIPPTETDWQDLQQRMNSLQRTPPPRTRTITGKAKIALAVCAAFALMAARFALSAAPRNPVSPSQRQASLPSNSVARRLSPTPPDLNRMAQNLNRMDQNSSPVTQNSNLVTQNSNSVRRNLNAVTRQTKTAGKNTPRFGRKRTRQLAARRMFRRSARPYRKAKTVLALTSKPKAPLMETVQIAQNEDAEHMLFFAVPLEIVLLAAASDAPKHAQTTYVTAAIPAAPTPGTTANQSQELHPW